MHHQYSKEPYIEKSELFYIIFFITILKLYTIHPKVVCKTPACNSVTARNVFQAKREMNQILFPLLIMPLLYIAIPAWLTPSGGLTEFASRSLFNRVILHGTHLAYASFNLIIRYLALISGDVQKETAFWENWSAFLSN